MSWPCIVNGNSQASSVSFIHSGLVELRASFLQPDVKEKVASRYGCTFNAVGQGSYFGDVSILLGVPVTATVRAVAVTTLYHLLAEPLLQILRQLPKAQAYMRQIAEARYSRLKLRNPGTAVP